MAEKKSRKHGRNADWCKAYRARAQRERNKLPRLVRHLATHPGDAAAIRKAMHCLTLLPMREGAAMCAALPWSVRQPLGLPKIPKHAA